MTPKEAEAMVAELLGGSLVTDLSMQFGDIDVMVPNEVGVPADFCSVKLQKKAAITGNLSLEVSQTNTRNGMSILGNFLKCEADYIAFVVPYSDDENDVYLISHEALLQYVKDHPMRKVRLSSKAQEENKRLGREYDSSESLLLPIVEAVKLAMKVYHGR